MFSPQSSLGSDKVSGSEGRKGRAKAGTVLAMLAALILVWGCSYVKGNVPVQPLPPGDEDPVITEEEPKVEEQQDELEELVGEADPEESGESGGEEEPEPEPKPEPKPKPTPKPVPANYHFNPYDAKEREAAFKAVGITDPSLGHAVVKMVNRIKVDDQTLAGQARTEFCDLFRRTQRGNFAEYLRGYGVPAGRFVNIPIWELCAHPEDRKFLKEYAEARYELFNLMGRMNRDIILDELLDFYLKYGSMIYEDRLPPIGHMVLMGTADDMLFISGCVIGYYPVQDEVWESWHKKIEDTKKYYAGQIKKGNLAPK